MKIKVRERLSAPGLLEAVRVRVNRIIDPLKGKTAFPIADCLMSGLAMFSLKYRSLLQFDQSLENEKICHNFGALYGVDYGHGYKNLSSVVSHLMMLAFLIDQIQQLCCPQFQAALKKSKKRIRLWENMRSWFMTFFIDTWETFFSAIASLPDFRLPIDTG